MPITMHAAGGVRFVISGMQGGRMFNTYLYQISSGNSGLS